MIRLNRLFVSLTAFSLLATAGWSDVPSGNAGHTAAPTGGTSSAAAPAAAGAKDGEMSATITGKNKEKLVVDKIDPPAAFNLEDIQNFPEDRLQPILTVPVTFDEGRDFSRLLDFHEDQPIHPWLPQIARAPFLEMKSPPVEKSKEWTFAIIDQGGTTVSKQEGKGEPPAKLSWNGDDAVRGHIAVDTVYIPQLSSVDKEGYHHTFMGQPIQFSSVLYKDGGKTVIQLSSKRLFNSNKSDFSKEGPLLLEKASDAIREDSHLPFAIQPYDADSDLGAARGNAVIKYFRAKLFIPENEIIGSPAQGADKRGSAIAIISNGTPGGSAQ